MDEAVLDGGVEGWGLLLEADEGIVAVRIEDVEGWRVEGVKFGIGRSRLKRGVDEVGWRLWDQWQDFGV